MSRELAYHPPSNTKWVWFAKALNYSPWGCNLLANKEKAIWQKLWPMSCMLYVDLINDQYVWRVDIVDFRHTKKELKGRTRTALQAMRAAERAGEKILKQLLPPWAKTAVEHGWRPPA